ncbi:hypothetical protein [Parapedobacter soli]|uniref:hypothetical protein n=1 Tax=Parapedobacter soli TaxID=416955 RepID=UPI0021C7137F|nr:hypothetical protein [Parapedobacter soli]
MNYPNDFINADHLSESQKSKLMAVYNTIRIKDIISQAIEFLGFQERGAGAPGVYEFLQTIRLCMRLCARDAANDAELKNSYELLERLHCFFDTLNSDDFNVILDIDKACQYSDETGGYDNAINKLYIETKERITKKLKSMELQIVH